MDHLDTRGQRKPKGRQGSNAARAEEHVQLIVRESVKQSGPLS